MIMPNQKIALPSDDKRWKVVETTIRRNGSSSGALIETLHSVQEWFGYLDDEALTYVAQRLMVPLSKVYGVATFYHFFTLKPGGKHTCVVCNGTACYIKGAKQLIDSMADKYGVKPGETSKDGQLSVLSARCLGSCGLAPAVVINGDVKGNISTDELLQTLEGVIANDA
jgi:bidirectional [NiFe] hydrogenase diaphorase subunit